MGVWQDMTMDLWPFQRWPVFYPFGHPTPHAFVVPPDRGIHLVRGRRRCERRRGRRTRVHLARLPLGLRVVLQVGVGVLVAQRREEVFDLLRALQVVAMVRETLSG
jgi:hypothetical protein